MLKKLTSILIAISVVAGVIPVVSAAGVNMAKTSSAKVICSNETESVPSLLYDGITVQDKVKAYNMGKISENSYIEYDFGEMIFFNELTVNEFSGELKIDVIKVEYSDFEETDEEEALAQEDSYSSLYEGKMPENGVLTLSNENLIMANRIKISPISYKEGKSGDILISEISVENTISETPEPVIPEVKEEEEKEDNEKETVETPSFTPQSAFSAELSFLKWINVASEDADGSMLLTRGEFAGWLVKLLKADPAGYVSPLKLKDVDEASPMYHDISYVFIMGYMSPKSAGRFEADEPVTLSEAAEALFAATGYKKLMAENGVEGMFLYHDIIRGVVPSKNGELTVNAAAKLTLNAMQFDIMEKVYSTTSDDNYYISEGKTLMKNIWKMSHSDNIVTVTDSASILNTVEKVEKGQVMIGNTLFDCSIPEIRDYIGKKIKFYYEYTKEMDRPAIRYFTERTSKTLNIHSDDIVSATRTQLVYTSDEMEDIRVNISGNATVLYNNRLLRYSDSASFMPENGEITLIDNDGSGYSMIIIKEGIDVLVSGVYKDRIMIKNENNLAELKLDDDTKYSLSRNNAEIGINEIKANNVLTVFPDKIGKSDGFNVIPSDAEYYEIKVSDNAVKGTLESISDDYMTIDGMEYKPTYKFLSQSVYSKKIGDSAKYYLNIYGKITASDAVSKSITTVGYVYKFYAKSTPVEVNSGVRVFTKDGHSEYKFAEKVSVNGNGKTKLTTSTFDNILTENQSGSYVLKPQLIKFSTNSDGLIDKIYTAVARAENIDNSAEFERSADKMSRTYLKNGLTFNNDFLVNTSTVIFEVPSDTTIIDEGCFKIRKVTDFSTYATYLTEAFDAGDFMVAPYMVVYSSETRTPNEKNNTVVVSKTAITVNDDGEQTKKIYFYEKGKLTEKTVDTDVLTETSIKNLRPGMVIQYSENLAGEINGVRIIFDYRTPTTRSPLNSYTNLQTLYGVVESINGSAFMYRIKTNGTDEITKPFQFMGANTYYYVFNTNTNVLFPATKNDIPVGDGNAMVFMRFYQGQSREVVIYQNN